MAKNEPIRSRARAALQGYFRKRSFPRLILGFILLLTGAVGLGVSYELLHAGLTKMWIRYPIAVLTAYAVMLGLVRLWIEIEQRRFDPSDAAMREAIQQVNEGDLQSESSNVGILSAPSGGKKSGRFDLGGLDGCMDFGGIEAEGCVFGLLVAVVVGLVAVLAITLAGAPVLIAEVFLDAFLIGALYRKLHVAAQENWLSTAVRKTWKSAAITAVLLCMGGAALEYLVPGAHSIGQAIHRFWKPSR